MNSAGVLIFAHNNDKIDYFKLSILSSILAKKKLNLPISIVTDPLTLSKVKHNDYFLKYSSELDNIIEIDLPKKSNLRNYKNDDKSYYSEFFNFSRSSALEVSPYQRTILLDSDYLTLSGNLRNFIDLNSDLLISKSYNDILGKSRIEYNNVYVSATGIDLKWATTVIFSKNDKTELFFDLVKYIEKNYFIYSRIFRFDSRLYRNDISFSLALHILNGYCSMKNYELPSILSVLGTDSIFDVKDGKIFFLIDSSSNSNKMISLQNQDIHVMNKIALLENFDKLIQL